MWTTGILAILCVCLYFAFRSPACQTWISQQLADYMSDELKTKVSIQGVDIKFFTSIELEGIYVEDQHGDTLLNAPSLTVNISNFSYGNQYVSLDQITLTNATIKLKKYKDERGLNYRFLLLYFRSADTNTTPPPPAWNVDLGKIKLENVSFAYIDTRHSDVDRGMDYENIRTRNVYATIERIEPMGDSTSIFLSELKATEQCGLTLTHMESRLMIADTFMKFNDLVIQTPGSDIKGFLSFHFDSIEDIEDDFIHRVKLDCHFTESIVEMGDVAYFSPVLLGIQKRVMVTGDAFGTIEKLKTKNMDIRFGKKSRIAGNFAFDGLPDIETTDMHFKFKEATTNYEDLSGIPIAPFNDSSFLKVSPRIELLGDMHFVGTVEGFTHDFVAHGKLRTDQGNLVLENLIMSQDSLADDYNWEGILTAEEFNIGNFLGVPEIGHISGTANMIGYGTDVPSMVASMNAEFSAFEFHNYRYSNITVTEGSLAKEVFDGVIDVHDPNVDLHYDGYVDFVNPQDPQLRFTASIDSANVSALGFADTSLHLIVSTGMVFKMHGNNIDNLRGSISLSQLKFSNTTDSYELNEMTLISTENAGRREMYFFSDFVRAEIKGQFELLKIQEAISDVMTAYLPAYFPPHANHDKHETFQHFDWTATFGNNTDALAAFVPKLKIAPRTFCQGSFNQESRGFTLVVDSDSIRYDRYQFQRISIANSQGNGGKAQLHVVINRAQINDTMGFDAIRFDATAGSNVMNSTLQWNNVTERGNHGVIATEVVFENKRSLQLTVEEATSITVNDTTWQVDPTNFVRKDSSTFWIKNLVFRAGSQTIGLNGKVSRNPNDHLDISLDRFNLAALNYLVESEGISISGYLSGSTVLSSLYDEPKFTGNSVFTGLLINKEVIGDGTIDAIWQGEKQAVYINGKFNRKMIDDQTGQVIDNIVFSGLYYPKKEEDNLDMSVDLRSMQLGMLQPLLADFCSMVVGHVSGHVDVKGNLTKPLLNGVLDVSIAKVKVDYLGLELTHRPTQPLYIEENSFFFKNFEVTDNQRDTCSIYGHLYHDNFKKWQFDMDFAFEHFQVLNTTAKDNEDFYGRVYATGFMNIFGYTDGIIKIDIKAKTDKVIRNGQPISSDFNIPMSTTDEVGENEYIVFEKDTVKPDDSLGVLGPNTVNVFKKNGIDLTLMLEATPDALVHIIFDETVGDEITARGTGDLLMHISPAGELTMYGTYIIDRGDYLFTLKNIVYAPFEIERGGVISWNGDPALAAIDIDAIYYANASVEPFFPFHSTTAAYQQSYPVHVIMHLDSNLVDPKLSFDIELPTADQNIQETVRSYTQSELEMNRQVLSLMVLNSFMTPAEFREGADGGSEVGGAGSTLLSNFVSGTLNNWLSQISENANLKFKYRPNEDMSLQELKVALSTQILNNRVTFDVAGSIVNANQTQTQGGYNQYVDANVEYKVTEDGKVRLRAFNRGNESNGINQGAQHTQGAGVFYREEFESFSELMQRYKENLKSDNPNRKKTEEPVVIPPAPVKDSLVAPPDSSGVDLTPSR